MKIKLVLLSVLLLAFGSVGFAQSTTAQGIRAVDFLNYSYRPSVCSEDVGLPKTVRVRQGKFKAGDNFYNVTKEDIVYGDVNGDGTEDAVIQIRCGSAAGTLRAFEVHAYTFRNGRAKLLARIDSTGVESDYKKSYPDGTVFYAGDNAPKIERGALIVEALTDGSFAGPENVATFNYKLSGDRFVLSGGPSRTKRAQ